ncbi:MAG: sulfatase-like hydrolase/transferase [Fimbriimonadaceae bacterium]|nr:sulfatase-like hydrolase/transferase [Chitinophagales bacterium]
MKLITTLAFAVLFTPFVYTQVSDKPNIIFIVLDDLNNYVSGYNGQPQMETPGIQSIADNGTTFTNAFCNAPECAPSRTSFLTGKLPHYTEVYDNSGFNSEDFRGNFAPGKYILTFPEYLKDSAGYFTVACNKIFHEDQVNPDYDSLTNDVCSKRLSWNKVLHAGSYTGYGAESAAQEEGGVHFPWASIDSTRDNQLEDYNITDTAIQFLEDYANDAGAFCNKPFFLGVGYHFPHLDLYVPENFFLPDYIENFNATTFDIPYNNPVDDYPYNGVVMPPRPEIPYSDFDSLGYMGKRFAGTQIHNDFESWYYTLDSLPVSLAGYSLVEKKAILVESKKANAVMAYMAAVKYADAQIARLVEALQSHPEILNNTVIILISDHGFSLGEKKHWKKSALWETDIHMPLIITDYRNIETQICKSAVSLSDLFPTICNFAQISEPLFPTGAKYTDGSSLIPLLTNPDKFYNKPVLTIIKNTEFNQEGRCHPQFSVRSNAMHYILYKSNSAEEDILNCNDALSFTEEELYEIGINRDRDIHEWNNLAADPDYNIVKKYLRQWLPDSIKYLQATYSLKIEDNACYHNAADDVNLSVTIINKNGTPVTGIPSGKHLLWWTNLGSDSSFTTNFDFSLSSIPEITSGDENEVLVYTALYNSTFDIIEALEINHIKIENDVTLFPSFKVKTKKKRVNIINVTYPAGVTSVVWEYGDGYIYSGFTPPMHLYPTYGNYEVICKATIGGCAVTKKIGITLDAGSHVYTRLSPNPVKDHVAVNINASKGNFYIEIFNSAGIKVLEKYMHSETGNENIIFNTQQLPAGSYLVKITGEGWTETQKFMKAD